jgi:hypothetical protein
MNWKAKKFYLPLCAAAFTTIAVNGGALADSISLGPESFLTNSIDSSMFGSNEFSDTLTFDLFDGNLGTLTGVSMEIDYLHDSFLDVGGLEGGHGTSNHQGQISFALLSVANEVVFSGDLDAACSGSFASCDDSVFGGV